MSASAIRRLRSGGTAARSARALKVATWPNVAVRASARFRRRLLEGRVSTSNRRRSLVAGDAKASGECWLRSPNGNSSDRAAASPPLALECPPGGPQGHDSRSSRRQMGATRAALPRPARCKTRAAMFVAIDRAPAAREERPEAQP